jgi:pyruvate decarboxylase
VLPEVEKLLGFTRFPYFTHPRGKGFVTEDRPNFGGFYVGLGSKQFGKDTVEPSDCVLWIGNLPSYFNTGELTEDVAPKIVIKTELTRQEQLILAFRGTSKVLRRQ